MASRTARSSTSTLLVGLLNVASQALAMAPACVLVSGSLPRLRPQLAPAEGGVALRAVAVQPRVADGDDAGAADGIHIGDLDDVVGALGRGGDVPAKDVFAEGEVGGGRGVAGMRAELPGGEAGGIGVARVVVDGPEVVAEGGHY